jgi:lipopolysaccharide export LptBFGC system permease protein LptF
VPGGFSLGRFGLPINIIAVCYGLFMAVNMAWPRPEVYDPAGGHWYLKYFAVLSCSAAVLLGLALYRVANRGRGAADPVAADATAEQSAAAL